MGQSPAEARDWSPPVTGRPVTEVGRPAEQPMAAPKYLPGREPQGGAEGEAIGLRVLFTLNYSVKQTHYLGTRIKSHSLYFN